MYVCMLYFLSLGGMMSFYVIYVMENLVLPTQYRSFLSEYYNTLRIFVSFNIAN